MITATFDRAAMEIRVEGHADYAPHGQDIVCAGMSVLWYTLRSAVEREQLLGRARAEITEDCVKCAGGGERVQTIFETIWQGMRLLESRYGTYLRCRERGC